MGFSGRKISNRGRGKGGLRTYFFWKKRMELFRFFSVSLEISKRKFHPRKFGKVIYVTSLRNFKAKNQRRPLETLHEFFLVSIGYFLLFLINSWKFWNTPGNSISSTISPLVWIFSRIVQSQRPCASSNAVL